MNIFNEKEFLDICERFNVEPYVEEVTQKYETDSFFNKMKASIENDRRGEVVFCVVRPNGKVIAITCSEYPQGIFRIPTGGIGHHEDVVEAAIRETKEELGLTVEILKFIGVLKIKFEYNDEQTMFYSYLFILKETGGILLTDATDDEVSEVREADIDELKAIVSRLHNIGGKWSNWGRFRSITSGAILRYLENNLG